MSGRKRLLKGVGASAGVGVGPAYVLERQHRPTPRRHLEADAVTGELARLAQALTAAESELTSLAAQANPFDAGMEILEAHRLMLRDPVFIAEIEAMIRGEQVNAEWAVRQVARRLREPMDSAADEYLRERRSEITFVEDRLVQALLGGAQGSLPEQLPQGAVVVAADLSAEDVLSATQRGVMAAVVTERGGLTSHTSIVARALGLPAVLGVFSVSDAVLPGDVVAVDGTHGVVLVNPDAADVAGLRAQAEQTAQWERAAVPLQNAPALTADGVAFRTDANIEFVEDVDAALAYGATGIGLFRTEFLFLDRATPPSEEEQLAAYRRVLERMGGREVTIRTADLGGDKLPLFEPRRRAADVAMGVRGIRYSLKHPELFRTQLRALLRAGPFGNLRVMFPLVADLFEVREARRILEDCRQELLSEGQLAPDGFPVGIMVETPSAALLVDRFAAEVDFFAVGTNDLIQFLLAIDRREQEVSYLYHPFHPSVLRVLQMVATGARAAGIPACVCGEMASDPVCAQVLVAMGFDAVSTRPRQIPSVRQALQRADTREVRAVLEEAMSSPSAYDIDVKLRQRL